MLQFHHRDHVYHYRCQRISSSTALSLMMLFVMMVKRLRYTRDNVLIGPEGSKVCESS